MKDEAGLRAIYNVTQEEDPRTTQQLQNCHASDI
jgi:hypothetical protein